MRFGLMSCETLNPGDIISLLALIISFVLLIITIERNRVSDLNSSFDTYFNIAMQAYMTHIESSTNNKLCTATRNMFYETLLILLSVSQSKQLRFHPILKKQMGKTVYEVFGNVLKEKEYQQMARKRAGGDQKLLGKFLGANIKKYHKTKKN